MKERVQSGAAPNGHSNAHSSALSGARLSPRTTPPSRPASRKTRGSSASVSRIGETGAWHLPSGKPLAEFALHAGFLAPLLFAPQAQDRRRENPAKAVDQAEQA
jgi:hypothetical protein